MPESPSASPRFQTSKRRSSCEMIVGTTSEMARLQQLYSPQTHNKSLSRAFMDKSFPLVMVAVMVVVAFATIWLIKRFVQPPTAAGKKRLTIFLRFIVAQYVILTAFVLLSIEQVLQPRLLGILGLANLVGSFLIMWSALKR